MFNAVMRPLVGSLAGMFCGLAAALMISDYVQPEEWQPERAWLVATLAAGAGSFAGTLIASLLNIRLAMYWFWLAAIGAAVGFIPLIPAAAGGLSPLWQKTLQFDPTWLLVHSLIATGLAVIVTVTHLSLSSQGSKVRLFHGPSLLASLLLLIVVLGLLWKLEASPLVYVAALAPLTGRQLSTLLTVLFNRGEEPATV